MRASLAPGFKLILLAIHDAARETDDGYCFAGDQYIADCIGSTAEKVRLAMNWMIEQKIIDVRPNFKHNKPAHKINLDVLAKFCPYKSLKKEQ
jgi:hypothetical protein